MYLLIFTLPTGLFPLQPKISSVVYESTESIMTGSMDLCNDKIFEKIRTHFLLSRTRQGYSNSSQLY
jgi:hypothetical protein